MLWSWDLLGDVGSFALLSFVVTIALLYLNTQLAIVENIICCTFSLSHFITFISTFLFPTLSLVSPFFFLGKIQLTYQGFNQNLICLLVVWNLTFYPFEVWSKFKLPTYGLKSHDTSVPLDFFDLIWSCIFMFLRIET